MNAQISRSGYQSLLKYPDNGEWTVNESLWKDVHPTPCGIIVAKNPNTRAKTSRLIHCILSLICCRELDPTVQP